MHILVILFFGFVLIGLLRAAGGGDPFTGALRITYSIVVATLIVAGLVGLFVVLIETGTIWWLLAAAMVAFGGVLLLLLYRAIWDALADHIDIKAAGDRGARQKLQEAVLLFAIALMAGAYAVADFYGLEGGQKLAASFLGVPLAFTVLYGIGAIFYGIWKVLRAIFYGIWKTLRAIWRLTTCSPAPRATQADLQAWHDACQQTKGRHNRDACQRIDGPKY